MRGIGPFGRPSRVIPKESLRNLLEVLRLRGYTLIGPTVRDQAIVYDEISSPQELPIGWTDRQGPGTYRLERREDDAFFGFVVGPQSWKKFFFPPAQRLFQISRDGKEIHTTPDPVQTRKRALIGVRPCELRALAIQDRVFTGGAYVDGSYRRLREDVFILAVNCGEPAATCFCASLDTGPQVTDGFDLAITEVIEGTRHEFIVHVGSELGARVLEAVPSREATDADSATEREIVQRATRRMSRALERSQLKELLYRNYESPRWDQVAARCLSCANCTMVCPTCFCSTVEDVTDLSGDHAERRRLWDSCFTMDFSYIVGGSVRASTRARYRHWLTHKLATWQDQFGVIGCVGCGRCITWCPVGIDLTEEVAALRGRESPDGGSGAIQENHHDRTES
ncbi:MAG: 4Fe-4S dicluster domain-containing protein [Phycisphaerales bacterium]|nr:4Fe-4S dicluster domain-containing protein [Phycisphaerales bacterium]